MNARQIELPVAHHFSVFRNLVVPNVSHGFSACALWEIDLAVVTKAGYLYEVEIKTTASDLRREQYKNRWTNFVWKQRFEEVVSQYFIAMPEVLFQALKPQDWEAIPAFAGIITVRERKGPNDYFSVVDIKRPSKKKRGRKLSEREQFDLARLGTIRYWTRHEHKRENRGGLESF